MMAWRCVHRVSHRRPHDPGRRRLVCVARWRLHPTYGAVRSVPEYSVRLPFAGRALAVGVLHRARFASATAAEFLRPPAPVAASLSQSLSVMTNQRPDVFRSSGREGTMV
jgi:hypothetical protein